MNVNHLQKPMSHRASQVYIYTLARRVWFAKRVMYGDWRFASMLCASVTKDQALSSMLLLHIKVIVVQLSCGSVVTWLQALFLSLVEGGGWG